MNRTLKRPMFRIGGSAGTGITSGLDTPRKNYFDAGRVIPTAEEFKQVKDMYPQFQRPDIIRGKMQPSQVTPSQVRNPIGLNNAQVQSAMRRMSQRTNVNPQLQRIVDANMTTRQGRRTIGLGSSSMPRVTPAAPAAVRKTTATTEVS